MAVDSENNGDNAPKSILQTRELKRILLFLWTCRCLLMVLMGVAYVSMIWNASQSVEVRGGLLAFTILVILLDVLCLSLDLVSIILLSSLALKPSTFLLFQMIETSVWTAVVAFEVFTAMKMQTNNFVILFISCILFLSFIGLLAYASIIFHRSRQISTSHGMTIGLNHDSSRASHPFQDSHAITYPSRTLSTRSHDSIPPPPYSNRYSAISTRIRNSFIIFSAPVSPQKSRRTSTQYPTSFVIDTLPEESSTQPSGAHNSFEVYTLPEECPPHESPSMKVNHTPVLHRFA